MRRVLAKLCFGHNMQQFEGIALFNHENVSPMLEVFEKFKAWGKKEISVHDWVREAIGFSGRIGFLEIC
jgi:hypothetical protein